MLVYCKHSRVHGLILLFLSQKYLIKKVLITVQVLQLFSYLLAENSVFHNLIRHETVNRIPTVRARWPAPAQREEQTKVMTVTCNWSQQTPHEPSPAPQTSPDWFPDRMLSDPCLNRIPPGAGNETIRERRTPEREGQ